jgi:hypothetical protein
MRENAMAKFGLFHSDVLKPMQVYSGDRMAQDKDYVTIYKKDSGGQEQQVAGIKLADGQSVKGLD